METETDAYKPEYVLDLKKIETLTQKNSVGNTQFSNWLKTQTAIPSNEIDSIVREISTQVASAIDCTKCANCCKALIVGPDYRDVSSLAEHFQMTSPDFKKKYLKKDSEGDLVFKQRPCPFLKNNACSVYSCRPGLCRNYPYLDKGQFLSTLGRTLRNLSVCPIVFNTFELLKLRFS